MFAFGGFIGGFVGFFLGSFVGGPIFGIIGAIIGSSLGRGLHIVEDRGGFNSQAGTSGSDNMFFVSLFSMLGKMAKADGSVSDSEMNTVRQFMVRDLNLDGQLQNQAMMIFNNALNSPESFEQYAQQFYIRFRGRPQFIQLMLDALLRVAYADNQIHPAEQHLLDSAVRIFRVPAYTYESLKNRYASGGSSGYSGGSSYRGSSSGGYSGSSSGSSYSSASNLNYAVLGCTSSSTDAEIKKAYRKKVAEFHPDKIAAKGLPAEFTKFASDKFREIQEAYEAIKKARNL
ncbi:MAG: co-chaperone DjlA [Spirochaetales bacterium]|nr:co-chaperone DjlA [Spirochaetales bacterium]